MKKILKWTGIGFAGLIVLIIILAAAGIGEVEEDQLRTRSESTQATTRSTIAPTTTANRQSDPITLSGRGQDVTRGINLSEGRWRITAEVSGNTDEIADLSMDTNFVVEVYGGSGAYDLPVNEIAASGSWTSQLSIGDDLFDFPVGEIWFEVTAGAKANWTITVAPL